MNEKTRESSKYKCRDRKCSEKDEQVLDLTTELSQLYIIYTNRSVEGFGKNWSELPVVNKLPGP